MNFEEKINNELKAAIKSGDKLRMETIRSLRAAIIEFNKSGVNRELNSDDELKILQNAAKKRKDAIELYEKGNRQDLADKERSELLIINELLPEQMSAEAIKLVIKKIIADTGASGMKDIGKVMGASMKELKGQAEGAVVQQIVKNLLGSE